MQAPLNATVVFTLQMPLVHTWHWAFRRLEKAHGCITLTEIGDSTIDRINIAGDLAELESLKDKAPDTPEWEEALRWARKGQLCWAILMHTAPFFPWTRSMSCR